MGDFSERVVIVTGAARGLGCGYARYFARDGAEVVVADLPDTAASVSAAAAEGTRCIGGHADVTDRASVRRVIERTRDEFGRLDSLINNAGLWRGLTEGGLVHCADETWAAAWAVDVTGTLHCDQEAVALMSEGGFGRIVNVTSMASRSGGNVYGLTKHAVERTTMGMAREVGDRGITVNCIAPGISAFEAARTALPSADQIVAADALERLGTRRDLYGAIAYLCSPAAAWVTGQVLRVDGGAGVS